MFTQAFLLSFARWGQGHASFESLQNAVARQELRASTIRIFCLNILSGLLQTPDYARALYQNFLVGLDSEAIFRAVNSRLRRQKILNDRRKVIQIIQSEATFGNWFAPRSVMRAQLRHLLKVAEKGQFEFRVLPLCVYVPVVAVESFVIYDSDRADVETMTINFQFWERKEIELYEDLYSRLIKHSVVGEEAERIVRKYVS